MGVNKKIINEVLGTLEKKELSYLFNFFYPSNWYKINGCLNKKQKNKKNKIRREYGPEYYRYLVWEDFSKEKSYELLRYISHNYNSLVKKNKKISLIEKEWDYYLVRSSLDAGTNVRELSSAMASVEKISSLKSCDRNESNKNLPKIALKHIIRKKDEEMYILGSKGYLNYYIFEENILEEIYPIMRKQGIKKNVGIEKILKGVEREIFLELPEFRKEEIEELYFYGLDEKTLYKNIQDSISKSVFYFGNKPLLFPQKDLNLFLRNDKGFTTRQISEHGFLPLCRGSITKRARDNGIKAVKAGRYRSWVFSLNSLCKYIKRFDYVGVKLPERMFKVKDADWLGTPSSVYRKMGNGKIPVRHALLKGFGEIKVVDKSQIKNSYS